MDTEKLQRKSFLQENKELTMEEYKRLLNSSQNNRKFNLILQTICSTGIRVSELRFITMEAVNKGTAQINNKGKIRNVLLRTKLCELLRKYAQSKKIIVGAIFITKNGTPLDRSNIWSEMKKLCKKANVTEDKVFPHNLRHLFARTYYNLQKDIVHLADILGHSNINTTRIYTIVNEEVHRKQIEKLGLLRCCHTT